MSPMNSIRKLLSLRIPIFLLLFLSSFNLLTARSLRTPTSSTSSTASNSSDSAEVCDKEEPTPKYYYKNLAPSQPESILETPIPMANLEGEPSAFINGHVNVITGDFNDFQVDLIVPGIEKLTVERSFSGSTEREGSLAAGWNLNLYGTLRSRRIKERGIKRFQVFVSEGHGATSMYEKKLLKKDKETENTPISLHRSVYRRGVTNTSAGYISGQTNIRNNKLYKSKESYR
ncbi:MAG: hypothetical protein H0X26_10505, partial [Alphaproteobacteria bacterium]|nr:hypothetical protein [Alphaproteobacteria bacterium]